VVNGRSWSSEDGEEMPEDLFEWRPHRDHTGTAFRGLEGRDETDVS
jgi:hypothetical protein